MQVTVRKVVEVTASADDWGLYDLEKRDLIAHDLNEFYERCVESGLLRHQVQDKMERYMALYSKVGAADTEGRNTLEQLLDLTF